MSFEIRDDLPGVQNSTRYKIEDTAETEQEWRRLLKAFCNAFPEFTNEDEKDFELADWHHGMMVIPAYLLNEGFYTPDFIPKVQSVLKDHKRAAFGQFECYDSSKREIGLVMIFSDEILFNRQSEQTGLIKKFLETAQ